MVIDNPIYFIQEAAKKDKDDNASSFVVKNISALADKPGKSELLYHVVEAKAKELLQQRADRRRSKRRRTFDI